jgi:hypothetical protein
MSSYGSIESKWNFCSWNLDCLSTMRSEELLIQKILTDAQISPDGALVATKS